jgi:hypothetical protein
MKSRRVRWRQIPVMKRAAATIDGMANIDLNKSLNSMPMAAVGMLPTIISMAIFRLALSRQPAGVKYGSRSWRKKKITASSVPK